MINTATDRTHAATSRNCASAIISQTEFWNMKRNYSGYWQNENDVKNYLTTAENGSVLVS